MRLTTYIYGFRFAMENRVPRFGVGGAFGYKVRMTKLREDLKAAAECGLPAALEVMGERWSFLILRAAFNGLAHFEEFSSQLGIARNILSNRLARLFSNGNAFGSFAMDCLRNTAGTPFLAAAGSDPRQRPAWKPRSSTLSEGMD